MPEDFDIDIDDDDEMENDIDLDLIESLISNPKAKYSVGDKVVAVGGYTINGYDAIAVVEIKRIDSWPNVNPREVGTVYIVEHIWGDSAGHFMPVVPSKTPLYYVDQKNIRPLGKERTVQSLRKKWLPHQVKKRRGN